MKKRPISLALALLLLAGCNSQTQDPITNQVEESADIQAEEQKPIEDTKQASKTEEAEKSIQEPIKEKVYSQNNPSLGEMIYSQPNLDIESIPDLVFENAYNMPNGLYETYLATNMRQYQVPEEELIGSMKGAMGQDVLYCGETGLWPDSIPIVNAINEASYKVVEDITQRGNDPTTYMSIPEGNGIINDYTAFLDPNEAEKYRETLSTYDLPNYLTVCYSTHADNPLGRWFLRYSGTYEYEVFKKDYPSGISVTTYLSYSETNYPCYITYIGLVGEELQIGSGFYGIWAMPIDLSTLEKITEYRYDMLPVIHMITGKGFINIR